MRPREMEADLTEVSWPQGCEPNLHTPDFGTEEAVTQPH
jgi:hypothetical protein